MGSGGVQARGHCDAASDTYVQAMAKTAKLPSPCIGVCTFKRQGHCIACSMTKEQKKLFKAVRKPSRQAAFLTFLLHQQASLGRYAHWRPAYLKKLRKKGRPVPPMLSDRA